MERYHRKSKRPGSESESEAKDKKAKVTADDVKGKEAEVKAEEKVKEEAKAKVEAKELKEESASNTKAMNSDNKNETIESDPKASSNGDATARPSLKRSDGDQGAGEGWGPSDVRGEDQPVAKRTKPND